MSFPERIPGKLPDVGTTIFTVMSRRATEQGAVNVGQGFPDYPIDPDLAACVTDAVAAGFNQYAPMEGSVALRAAIAAKIAAAGGRGSRPRDRAHGHLRRHRIYLLRHPGRGRARATKPSSSTRPTTPTTRPSGSPAGAASTFRSRRRISAMTGIACAACISERTRLIIINNPHNPACTVATAADLDALAAADARPAHRRARRRGLRTRPVRRPRAPVGHEPRRAAITQLRGLFLRQDAAHHRLARGLLRGAAGADARAAQGAPVQHLQHRRAAAGRRSRSICSAIRMRGARWRRSSAPSATCCASGWPAAASRCRRRRAPIFSSPTIHRSAATSPRCNDVEFTERLINEAGVAVIPLSPFYREPPAGHAHRAAVRGQAR